MHIHEIQQDALALCQRHGWQDRNPDQRFRFLISEVGELTKELLRLEWEPSPEEVVDIKQNIGHEIYDIVWNLCDLATQLEIDLETAFAEKRAFNEKRWG